MKLDDRGHHRSTCQNLGQVCGSVFVLVVDYLVLNETHRGHSASLLTHLSECNANGVDGYIQHLRTVGPHLWFAYAYAMASRACLNHFLQKKMTRKKPVRDLSTCLALTQSSCQAIGTFDRRLRVNALQHHALHLVFSCCNGVEVHLYLHHSDKARLVLN